MAALLAITAWITLGLILTAIAWALSRWLGGPREVVYEWELLEGKRRPIANIASRGEGSQGATDRRKVRTGHVRTHDGTSL